MSDSEEFEKLTMLEGRLAAALDRIAVGLGEMQGAPIAAEDPGITSAALEDASLRAEAAEAQVATLMERVGALETRLDEAQSALAEAETQLQQPVAPDMAASDLHLQEQAEALAAVTSERDALLQQAQALEAARVADRDELNRILSDRDANIAHLKTELHKAEADRAALTDDLAALRATGAASEPVAAAAPARPVSDADAELEEIQEELEFARSRVRRLRQERNAARAELEAARHAMDDLTTPSDAIDARVASIRGEVAALRSANEDLIEQMARLREDGQGNGTVVSEALMDEVVALRAARASEAAELERIMAELSPALREGDQHG